MAPATEPTFNTNEQAAETRVKDYIEIAFKPTLEADPVVFARISLTTDLGGFAPNRTVVRKDTFAEADGSSPSLVSIISNGGSIQFATASKAALANRLLKASVTGETILFKANYVSAGRKVWGSGKVNDRGIQGGRNDIPDWGYTLEAETAKYVDALGELIA